MKALIVYLIVVFTLFAPGYWTGFGFPTIHVEDIIILLAVIGLAFSGRRSFGDLLFPPHLRKLTIPYSFALFYVLLITVLLVPLFPPSIITTGLFSALSQFKAMLLVFVVFAMLPRRQQVQRLGTLLILFIFALFILMFCQKYNYFGVNDWLSHRYRIGEMRYQWLEGTRVFGTLGNPNDMGTALSILGTLAFARMIYGPGRIFRILSGVAVALALICCVWLAATRQGTVCLLAGCFVVQMVAILRSGKRGWGTIGIVLAIVGLMVAMTYLAVDPRLAKRFGVLTGETALAEEGSIAARLRLWPSVIDRYSGWLVVGKGKTALTIDPTTWDSGYINILIMGGFPALMAVLAMLFLSSVWAWRRIRLQGGQHPDAWLYASATAIIAPILLANIVNNTLNNAKVMSLVVLIYAMSFAAMRTDDREYNEEILYGDFDDE